MPSGTRYPVLSPDLQVAFHFRLENLRGLYFGGALTQTVEGLDIEQLDRQLARYVPKGALTRVASFGLRGEVVFPVPCLLVANPYLLGYYRLLYGLSQKEFYSAGPFGRFIGLEERGEVPTRVAELVPALCRSLVGTGEKLVEGIGQLTLESIHELQLLTLGPYLRGGQNTRIGAGATREVFSIIKGIVDPALEMSTDRLMRLKNASGRIVVIEFGADPDVRIEELLDSGPRPLVSMEIKGGTDVSNIHNRLGEAEKSHQKAKKRGFFEFWTLVRCDLDLDHARRETPTTGRFFHIDSLQSKTSPEYRQFRDLLCSVIGIPV